jgi:flavin reductase (DIM6/NTAB) family NADH-FMN oxidoreductase RutF
MSEIDQRVFRDTMGQFCTGVVIATGCREGEPAGFAAQSFSSVSLDPPLVVLCPAKTSTSWPKLRDSGSFCINILGEDQKAVPVLADVIAYVDCDLHAEHDAGDHTLAVGLVREVSIVNPDKPPLLFFRGGYGQFEGL